MTERDKQAKQKEEERNQEEVRARERHQKRIKAIKKSNEHLIQQEDAKLREEIGAASCLDNIPPR